MSSDEKALEFEDKYPDACLECLAGVTHGVNSTWHKYAIKDAQDLFNTYNRLKIESLSLLKTRQEAREEERQRVLNPLIEITEQPLSREVIGGQLYSMVERLKEEINI